MTFKDIQKLVQSQQSPEHNKLLTRIQDKPFWIWDKKQHKQEDIRTKSNCCFNHIIGLPMEESELYEVDAFGDPSKALSSFQPSRYNLVILDIRMPYMDGFELYKNIKAIDGTVKVCFLTAVNDLSEYKINYPDLIEEIEKGDIHCFIDKPIGSQELLKQINNMFAVAPQE